MALSTIVSSMEKNSHLNKILSRKESEEVKIEDVIDINAQLTSFKENKLDMIKAIDLYNSWNLFSKVRIFRHYSERLFILKIKTLFHPLRT